MRSAIWIISLTLLFPVFACEQKSYDPSASTGSPVHLIQVEDELLALINAERAAADLPALQRDDGLDQIILWYGIEMATQNHLGHTDGNGRRSNDRAKYYSQSSDVRCSEIVQWWSGEPSGRVHYEGYKSSGPHHDAYMERGRFDLGHTSHAGVIALRGNGPAESNHDDMEGSYTAVMMCDRPLTIAIDPFSEETN
jgi:hypothetical protein